MRTTCLQILRFLKVSSKKNMRSVLALTFSYWYIFHTFAPWTCSDTFGCIWTQSAAECSDTEFLSEFWRNISPTFQQTFWRKFRQIASHSFRQNSVVKFRQNSDIFLGIPVSNFYMSLIFTDVWLHHQRAIYNANALIYSANILTTSCKLVVLWRIGITVDLNG